MALSRPVLIAVVGGVLALVALFAMRSSGAGGEEEVAPLPEAPAQQAAAAGPADAAEKKRAREPKAAGARDAEPAAAAPAEAAPAPEGVPADVAKALSAGKVVVLFFGQDDGADDAATGDSVRAAKRLDRRVAVFTDSIDDLGAYERVISGLGIHQAPAIVVVGPEREAQVLEGYIDAGTLAQTIRDTR